MSGRLIILPKKSYCPWNPENVDRVTRDEEEHKRKLDEQRKEEERELSRSRLEKLRGVPDNVLLRDKDQSEVQQCHVNLFASEETASKSNSIAKENSSRPRTFLESTTYGKAARKQLSKQKDEKVKERIDPMRRFSSKQRSTAAHEHKTDSKTDSTCESGRTRKRRESRSKDRRRSDKRRRKSSTKEDRKESSTNSRDIEELRRRRAVREEKERQRQHDLTGGNRGGRMMYQNQYNPDLSRR